jgi:hypothetical protein
MSSMDFAAQAGLAAPRTHRLVAGLCLVQTALFVVPMVVLGAAIGWPASLRLAPADALPLIAANLTAVLVGYWAYLLVSVALIPLAFAMRSFLAENGARGPMLDALTFIGAAAGVLKTLGIVRWLSAMPSLAAAHADAPPGSTRREAIETAYLALNGYAGSIGELLGVQLMSGIWLAGVGVWLYAARYKVTGLIGAVTGALFVVTALRTFSPGFAAIQSVAVPMALAWFVMAAITIGRRRAAV